MAEALNPAGPEPAADVPAPATTSAGLERPRPVLPGGTPTRAERARSDGYRRRFGLVYFLLAVISGAAVGSFLVVVNRPRAPAAQAWSTWRPTGNDTAKILEIADQVPQGYRLADGAAMVIAHASAPTAVTSTNGQSVSVPVSQITVLPKLQSVGISGSLQISLCGLGQDCKLASGTPSTARYELLRREALELALYTFKYVKTITSVAVQMPPAVKTKVSVAIFLSRTDVQNLLAKPISDTLSETTPAVGKMPAAEVEIVNDVTGPRTYAYGFQSGRDGTAVEILTPLD